MKQKIKEALQRAYVNLGLDETVFEGVASSVETLITDEAQIENFVKGAESMLKTYQSNADKARNEASEKLRKRISELEAGKGGEGDIAKAVADAISTAMKPIQDELAAIKGAKASENAITSAKAKFFANDYAKKFETERDDAWERAIEINEATGSKMTSEELEAKAMSYFTKFVSRKGVDTKEPFKADPDDNKEGTTDWSSEVKRLKEQGVIPA